MNSWRSNHVIGMSRVEAEFEAKLKALKAKYATADDDDNNDATMGNASNNTVSDSSGTTPTPAGATADVPTATAEEMEQQKMYQHQKKLEKAARKRDEARQKERDAEQALQNAKLLPNAKDTELQNMQLPERGRIMDVIADGHCLYRAIAAQIQNNCDYVSVRNIAADSLLKHRESLEAFCTSQFDDYVDRVRNSADWGGHLELRALSLALQRPIVVYSTGPPLTIGEPDGEGDEDVGAPIRLSYHLHYYALGEHYNQVVIEPVVEGNVSAS